MSSSEIAKLKKTLEEIMAHMSDQQKILTDIQNDNKIIKTVTNDIYERYEDISKKADFFVNMGGVTPVVPKKAETKKADKKKNTEKSDKKEEKSEKKSEKKVAKKPVKLINNILIYIFRVACHFGSGSFLKH